MVSNEERKEVAARLREKHSEQFGIFEPQSMGMQACNRLENLLDCLPERRDMFLVLADLIEPEPERTCRVEEVGVVDESGYYLSGITRDKCSNCGFVDDTQMWAEVYDYCPKCGTKVVG